MVDDTERPDQRIVLVRHALTEWSLTGRHTGRSDPPLTSEGRALTEHLRERLSLLQFARVLTSPLQRAAETCRIAGFATEADLCDDLMEWDYGVYEGRTNADIRAADPDWDMWRDGAPGGESPSDVARRIDRVVAELDESRKLGGNLLVFGHGHSLAALTVRWLGLPIEFGRHLRLDTGAVSVLGWKREVRVIDGWNDRGHLPGAQ
jgi:probable phosphoglycerate mutase